MSRRIAMLAVPALVAVLLAVPVATAEAADLPLATGGNMDVQLWPSEESTTGQRPFAYVILSATVPMAVPLPCRVRVPLPDGVIVTWAGELGGGGPATDTEREPRILSTRAGRVVEVEARQSREIQVDGDYVAPVLEDGRYTSTVTWVQTVPAATTSFGVKLAPQATDVKVEPSTDSPPEFNDSGEQLYRTEPKNLPLGTRVPLTARFGIDESIQAASPGAGVSGGTATGAVTIVIAVVSVLLLATLLAFGFVWSKQRRESD